MNRLSTIAVLLLSVSSLSLSGCGEAPAEAPSRPTPETPVPASATATLVGETPVEPFERWRVDRERAPALDVYVARGKGKLPLVVYVTGSKCLPVFMKSGNRIVSTAPSTDDVSPLLSRVHFAIVERRGLESFGPPPKTNAEAQTMAQCTAEHGGVAKEERVVDVADAVRALSREPWVSETSVLGHSEGADVAAGVGKELDGSLTGVGLLSGAGITRFFDEAVVARQKNDDDAVKKTLDDMIWITGPNASGDYRGASITRQITYAVDSTPLEDLRGAKLPVFVAGGTRDDSAPIASADAFVAELLRNRERKVSYLLLPGLDHSYADERGGIHWSEVFSSYIDWVLAKEKPRAITVRRL